MKPRIDPVQARRQLGWAAASLLVGVAASALGYAFMGGLITVGGMIGAAVALHRFGRSGPDLGAAPLAEDQSENRRDR